MRVTLKYGFAGFDENQQFYAYVAGSVIDLATDQAQRLIDTGRATLAEPEEETPEPTDQPKRGRKPKG